MLPLQKVKESDKTEQWHLDTARAIASWWQSDDPRTMTKKQEENCYRIISNDFDWSEFDYMTKPYGIEVEQEWGKMPARLREYNIIKNKVETLQGEELQRPFDFIVQSVFGEGLNERQEYKKSLFIQALQSKLSVLNGGEPDPQAPQFEEIEYLAGRTYRSLKESALNAILKVEQYKQNLKLKINQGFQSGLISAREIYRVGIQNNEPYVRMVHPLTFGCRLSAESNDISDADIAIETRDLTPSEVLEMLAGRIAEKDLDAITSKLATNYGLAPYIGSTLTPVDTNQGTLYQSLYRSTDKVKVQHCFWKSFRKMYYIEYNEDSGELHSAYFELSDELPTQKQTVKKEIIWRPEIRYATLINNDMIPEYGIYAIDFSTLKNPFKNKMPYRGTLYGVMGTRAQSFVQSVFPYLCLYLIAWYKVELELMRAKSSVVTYDISLLPKGMTLESVQYLADNTGWNYVQSMDEGTGGGMVPRTQQNIMTDNVRGMSPNVRFYLDIIGKIESIIDTVSGVAQQRQGVISSPSETATATNTAITYSQSSTAYLFFYHQQAKRDMLSGLLDTAKFCYSNSDYADVLFNEEVLEVIKTEGLDFNDTDYGIFLTDDNETYRIKQKMEQYAESALSSGKINQFSDLLEVLRTNSLSEASDKLKKAEQRWAQQQQDIAKQAQDAAAASQKAQNDFIANENVLNRQKDVQIALIKEQSNGQQDTINNQPLDMAKHKLSLAEFEHRRFVDNRKLDLEKDSQSLETKEVNAKIDTDKRKIDLDKQKIKVQARARVAR